MTTADLTTARRDVVLYQRTPAGRLYRSEVALKTLLDTLPLLLGAGRLLTVVLPDGTPMGEETAEQLAALEAEANRPVPWEEGAADRAERLRREAALCPSCGDYSFFCDHPVAV